MAFSNSRHSSLVFNSILDSCVISTWSIRKCMVEVAEMLFSNIILYPSTFYFTGIRPSFFSANESIAFSTAGTSLEVR
ncbi:hypothetical protein SAMN05428949_6162 [Chitinophaga sp. YR627]|nr:hypothetical protein SAMN05428949_6162 [Chitinophaga sp. YR627]